MVLTRRAAAFLLLAGAFPLLVWPNFLRVVTLDERAFTGGAPFDGTPTAFFVVHAVLAVASMALGLGLLVLGVRAWRRAGSRPGLPPS